MGWFVLGVLVVGVVWWWLASSATSSTKSRKSRTQHLPDELPGNRVLRLSLSDFDPGSGRGPIRADSEIRRVRGDDGIVRPDARLLFVATTPAPRADVPGLTAARWRQLIAAFDGCCRYCGQPLGKRPHREHRIPMARGGLNEAGNIVPCCSACNGLKAVATEEEYVDLFARVGGKAAPISRKAKTVMAELRSDLPSETRQVTMLRSLRLGHTKLSPYPRPATAVLVDPPNTDTPDTGPDGWVDRGMRVAGVTFRAESIEKLLGRNREWLGWAALLPEPTNPHDSTAVKVITEGKHIGYLPRAEAARIFAKLEKRWRNEQAVAARIWIWGHDEKLSARIHLTKGTRFKQDF